MRPNLPLRYLITLLLALASALLGAWLHTPLPWILGPLVVTAAASMLGAPTGSWLPLRNVGQWTIGAALGLYFTPQVTTLVAGIWWAVLLGIVWSLGLGMVFAVWLYRMQAPFMPQVPPDQMRATAWFASAIGGASEMTLLAERERARTDLVAASHSLRVLIVTITVPFALTWSGLHGLDLTPAGPREASWPGFVWLVLATGAGAWLMEQLGRTNPWFIGALLVSMGLTMAGIHLSAVPQWLSNAAQLFIGVSLGVRFTKEFMHTAPRWLGLVAAGTLGMIALCAAFAFGLSRLTGIHPATMILGTSPGGIAEMAITAKVLQLGVPVVTAFQVCRLIAVLVLVGPAYRVLFKVKSAT
jgi:membrane AbrB-like protein